MAKLIILDYYGTIVKADSWDYTARPGLREFLDHYKDSKKVIFSDGNKDVIGIDLNALKLVGAFDGIYDNKNCVHEQVYHAKTPRLKKAFLRFGKGLIKNLEQACSDFSIPKSEAVFIGDNFNGRDQKSAELNGVKFIRVPQFRQNLSNLNGNASKDHQVEYETNSNPFSFVSLIGRI